MPQQPPASLPTGTVTFLITDIQGSTRLLLDLGERYAEVLQRHHDLLRQAVAGAGGTTVSTAGDSVFAVFPSAGAAVAAAVGAQRELARQPWPDGKEVKVRMGIHTGEGTLGGDDYIGLDVHRTARIGAAAHGGQVVVSATTAALLDGSEDLVDLGQHRLKDLVRAEHLFQVAAPDLAQRFPPLRSAGGVRAVLLTTRTSYVPRPEADALAAILRDERLVTVTGPGGTGKTRLAIEVARRVKDGYPDGVVMVDLSPLQDPDLVAAAILSAMGIEGGSARPEDRLVSQLASESMLLVLDNFEHLLPAAALAAEVLARCPGLCLLVTSRSPLGVTGEQEFPLSPLPLLDPGVLDVESVGANQAVRLFVERARRVDPSFSVSAANTAALVSITRRLDGLPLALELAAARVRLLPPEAIEQRLAAAGAVGLATRNRDVPERQRTLEAAISWSYDLLPESAREAFERLSVFAGGAGPEEIAQLLQVDEDELLDLLATLVEQSLLRQEEASGRPRFHMLATIAEYAATRLAATGQQRMVQRQHADVYLGLAKRAAPHLTGWQQRQWLDLLEREHDNLRAALDRCIAAGDADRSQRLIAALWRFWQIRGHLDEASGRIEQALSLGGDDPALRASALEAAGGIAWWRGDIERARSAYRAALDILEPGTDLAATANARYNYGLVLGFDGSDDRAPQELQRARDEAREAGDRRIEAWAVWGLSDIGVASGDWEGAARYGEESLALFRDLNDPFGIGWALFMTASSDARQPRGDRPLARSRFREAIRLFAEFGDLTALAMHGRALARLEAAEGNYDRALRLIGAGNALRRKTGAGLLEANEALLDAFDSVTTEALAAAGRSPQDAARLIEEGARFSPDEAIAFILEQGPEAASS